ncbi:MAG: isoprenylcysteine carboxylmethyltransferase family protein, partial [Mesorhizobium sp.]
MTDHQPNPGQPKPGFIPWPPLIYLAAIAVSIALGLLYPLPWIGGLLGDILFAAGWVALFGVVALWFTAIRTMIRAKTTLHPNAVPDHLVTSGPFAVSRNPIYLANTLLMIGVALISGNVWF